MKYQEVLEPHRTLLFRLVEIYRERGEASSGLMPFRGVPTGILVYPRTDRLTLEAYSVTSLDVLERRGYLTIFRFTAPSPDQMALRKEALDYYDYSHSPVWRRRISDVWDKKGKTLAKPTLLVARGVLGRVSRVVISQLARAEVKMTYEIVGPTEPDYGFTYIF